MKHILITAALIGSLSSPALADGDELKQGMDKLGEATRLLLEGMMGQMAPMMEELNKSLGELNAYHPPEVLPNGDIIIRRKKPVDLPENGEVEL